MKTIRDRAEERIGAGVALAVVSGSVGAWLTAQLLPGSTGRISGPLCTVAFGVGAGWLGWRFGVVLADFGDRALRAERIGVIRASLRQIATTMVAPSTWVTGLGGAAGALLAGILVEQHPASLLVDGMSGQGSLSAAVATWVVQATSGVFGAWLGYHAQRIALDDTGRNEERRPNR